MKTKQLVATDITCSAPEAQKVFVAGTFNDWDPTSLPMKGLKSGKWKKRLKLEPGSYQYKFIMDGKWCCGPACDGDHSCTNCVLNEHGTMNRTLEVS